MEIKENCGWQVYTWRRSQRRIWIGTQNGSHTQGFGPPTSLSSSSLGSLSSPSLAALLAWPGPLSILPTSLYVHTLSLSLFLCFEKNKMCFFNWVACGLGLIVCDSVMLFDFGVFLMEERIPMLWLVLIWAYSWFFVILLELCCWLPDCGISLPWVLGFEVVGYMSVVVVYGWRVNTQVVIFFLFECRICFDYLLWRSGYMFDFRLYGLSRK